MTATDSPPAVLTLPRAATVLGVTSWELDGLLRRRADLAEFVQRAGGRRMILAEHLPRFHAALAEASHAAGQ